MISFAFDQSSFGSVILDNKIKPSNGSYKAAFDGFIVWKIKGVEGHVYTPQPHTNGDWSYMSHNEKYAPYLLTGKCSDNHATMILQYIAGKKWQSRIKKAYSARNRWVNGKPV